MTQSFDQGSRYEDTVVKALQRFEEAVDLAFDDLEKAIRNEYGLAKDEPLRNVAKKKCNEVAKRLTKRMKHTRRWIVSDLELRHRAYTTKAVQ